VFTQVPVKLVLDHHLSLLDHDRVHLPLVDAHSPKSFLALPLKLILEQRFRLNCGMLLFSTTMTRVKQGLHLFPIVFWLELARILVDQAH